MSDYRERTNNGTSFTGSDVGIFQALAIASALDLYAKTGMKANRSYTPTNMLKMANQITGHNYKRGQYSAAAAALREWADRAKAAPRN